MIEECWLRLSARCMVVLLAAALVQGCGSRPVLTYVAQVDSNPTLKEEVNPAHQQQIAAYLEYLYGTPVDPRLREPAAESEATEPAEAEEPASSATEAVAPPKIAIRVEDRVDRQTLLLGRRVYERQCAACHGDSGDGRGIAMIGEAGDAQHLNPPPRDYRGSFVTERATFKFTSTPLSAKPRRDDLRRILRFGAKGTSMPAFRWMPEEEREAVIDYVMHLSYRGELEIKLLGYVRSELTAEDRLDDETVAAIAQEIGASWVEAEGQKVRPLTVMPVKTQETIDAGAVAFAQLNCVKCHNRDARGSKTADVGTDNWGRTAFPADLTMGTLHGGRRSIDIYRRIYTGINGTPMPGSAEPDSQTGETPEQRSARIWHLVHFITTVIEANEVPIAQQKLIDDELVRIGSATPVEAAE